MSANDFRKQAERKARDEIHTQLVDHDNIFNEVLNDDVGIKVRKEELEDMKHQDLTQMVQPVSDKVTLKRLNMVFDMEGEPTTAKAKLETRTGKPDMSERCMTVQEYKSMGQVRRYDDSMVDSGTMQMDT